MKHIIILIFSSILCFSYAQKSILTNSSDTAFTVAFTFEELPFLTKKIGGRSKAALIGLFFSYF
jgi:hypothetical protein